MAYWLLKTEPGSWSWDDQVKSGGKGTEWTGVRNPVAQGNLRKMKKGDRSFFYHTGDEKAVVGIVTVVAEAHADSTDTAWEAVNVAAVEPLAKPVTLATVKADAALKEMALAKYPRLSVQPVTEAEWKRVLAMSKG